MQYIKMNDAYEQKNVEDYNNQVKKMQELQME
jgi:hypothetical protein